MVIIWGSRLFGKVDTVPGVFHVATKFGHAQYLPLIPMGTWLVFSQQGDSWRGVQIPFSFKSVLVAWFRVVAFTLSVAFGCMLLLAIVESKRNGDLLWMSIVVFGLALGAFIGSYFIPGIGRATPARVAQLAALAGFSADTINQIRQEGMGLPPTGGFPVLPPAAPAQRMATTKNDGQIPLS